MCIGMSTPDVASAPERQPTQQPQTDARADSRDRERARRGIMSTILTSTRGALAPPATTKLGTAAA